MSGSGPLAATAMMAALTRSTGMTSTMPSGTPGNSFNSPRAKLMITGSAMRKPRIQPGRGSASAVSMMDGRTMLTGTAPRLSVSARSPRALV